MTGTFLLVLAWILLGRFCRSDYIDFIYKTKHIDLIHEIKKTAALWIIPLVFSLPLFSRDIYSYLAQSEITARGLDPYLISPEQGLGLDHTFTRNIPNIWRDTPAPYGPLFLWIGSIFSKLFGENLFLLIVAHRILAIIGVLLIAWALPRLAKRCKVNPGSALWLGLLNPLVPFHLVSGIHNEAIMLGLMLAGIEITLAALQNTEANSYWFNYQLILGTIVITLSCLIKIPAIVALGFMAIAVIQKHCNINLSKYSYKQNFSLKNILNITKITLFYLIIFVATSFIIGKLSGLGMGWIKTLNTASSVRSWLSISTSLGMLDGRIGVLLGLGDQTDSILGIIRPIAMLVVLIICLVMLYKTLSNQISAFGAMGISFAALVLFFPVVQPWYILWALLPLAAWINSNILRISCIIITVIVSIMPLPPGAELKPYFIIESLTAAIIISGLILILTFSFKKGTNPLTV